MSSADKALWHKAWSETQWYFRGGLAFLLASAAALYIGYPDSYRGAVPERCHRGGGRTGARAPARRTLIHLAQLVRYVPAPGVVLVWPWPWPAPGIVRDRDGSPAPGVTYALSMPISRSRLAGVRMATGLLELTAAAILTSLLVSALARTQGQSFPAGEALVHALLAVGGATALYGLFAFLSATLGELNKAVLGGAFLFLYGLLTFLIPGVRRYSVFRVMTGDTYFLGGDIPWSGLVACCAFALALMVASIRVVERRDF